MLISLQHSYSRAQLAHASCRPPSQPHHQGPGPALTICANHRAFHGFQGRYKTQRYHHSIFKAVFDDVGAGIQRAWDMVKADGQLSKENIKGPMREIRRALLEADVSLPVVRGFVKRIEEKALGVKVVQGVRPDQQLVKVVNDELLQLLGAKRADLIKPKIGPRIILLAGLQGVGKTTACGKMAKYLMDNDESVLVVSTDVYRPAAIDQLEKLCSKIGADFLRVDTEGGPPAMAAAALSAAKKQGKSALLIDTAGRLQADDSMMQELKEIKQRTSPSDTLLVVDAMTGQEAAQLTKSFNEAVEVTGAVLTKLDGDSRGGAALSVKAVSGKPIKFVGTGETMDALEPFYPDRLASRILGMGDVLTLVEKAQEAIDEEDAQRLMKRMLSAKFDFDDFLQQYKAVNKMGSLTNVMKMIPGLNQVDDKDLQNIERKYDMYDAIIQCMTEEERSKPDLLVKSAKRKRQLALKSGKSNAEINDLLTTFTEMRVRMKTMSKMMAASGGMAMPGMNDNEMMSAIADSVGGRTVPAGLVRRRRKKPVKKQPVLAATSKGFGAS